MWDVHPETDVARGQTSCPGLVLLNKLMEHWPYSFWSDGISMNQV